ncbi:fatty acyl-CoA reductase wat-like [Copidosoma floridanum]|uniref:fatty acyl-CoA reductase wat-like n=1 Tax=Copidosoma floridanum TaxID=29053 RepID=UPI0006C97939|nr:fatty acyl-CoA reductase wat-like [Copidosoma floridanum]
MLLDIDIPQNAKYVYKKPSITSESNNNDITETLDLNSRIITSRTPLQEFYAHQCIFITGGTGFLGKILIEKLLRSCADLERIYVLVRPKKEKSIDTRMEELFNDPIYKRLKEENPKFHHKVAAVAGDCSLQGLGLSTSDRDLLTRDVSVVFHVAATVRFDEKLKLATAINVQSTSDILSLCKDMQKLKAAVHVSTAYANCISREIGEKFYDYPIKNKELLSLVNCLPEETVNEISPRIISPWPNTYAFTKAIAEDLIRSRNKSLPIGIFRPGIVISTANEPMPGWIDNFYGPTGIAAGVATGLLRTMHCDPKKNANIVPVDLTVNALIASAWDIAMETARRDEEMLIYNFVSSVDAPFTWQDFFHTNKRYVNMYPMSTALWYISFTMSKYSFVNTIYSVILHLVPAFIIDTLSVCVGRKPSLMKMYGKIHKFANVISYFCTREWTFSNDNVRGMWHRLDPRDRQMFYFTMESFNWEQFFSNYIKGIRVYLFKDNLKTIAKSKLRWQRFYYMHQVVKGLAASFGFLFLWKVLSAIFM